jgi:N-acetylmuramoyl-L-alanine amidase
MPKIEIELVGPITKALAQHCERNGFDVRVVTPKQGLGTFPGGLRAVAQTVVDWAEQGWTADIFLEVHAENNGNGDIGRGCFTIFPGVDGDTDAIVRDKLGPMISQSIREATGIPLRGNGVLSERKTHVFTAHNARLGIFQVTAPLRARCRRMIVEVGAYSSPADLKIMRRSDFADKTGQAIAGALADFFQMPKPELQWYRVLVETARTREGPSTRFQVALEGEALLHRGDVFAGDEIVQGEHVSGNPDWVHRADQIGFVSMALLERAV